MSYAAQSNEKQSLDQVPPHQVVSTKRRLAWIVAEFFILMAIVILVPLIVYFDAVVLSNDMKEDSLTEYLHNGLLLVTIGFIAKAAFKLRAARGYLIMGVTFFSCLFIREQDALFDHISKGFWVFPVLAAMIVGTVLVYRNRDTLAGPLLQHFETRSATFIYIGVLLLLVFTRTFGTGTLWEGVLGENYIRTIKSVVQEGLELMSYTLIAYGALTSYFTNFGMEQPK